MDNFTIEMIAPLAGVTVPSTNHLSSEEKTNEISRMIEDLQLLATKDGCVAAAWSLEMLRQVSLDLRKKITISAKNFASNFDN